MEIDQGDVPAVERFVVPGNEWWTLLAESLVLRDESFRRLRIVDDGTDLPGDEGTPFRVRLGVGEQVGVVAGQFGETRAVPHRLVEALALVLGVLERSAVVGRMVEPVHRGIERLSKILEVEPQPSLLLGR